MLIWQLRDVCAYVFIYATSWKNPSITASQNTNSKQRFEPTVWNYARFKNFSLNGIVIALWNTAVAPHCNTLRRA
jgi:hypothetical protein